MKLLLIKSQSFERGDALDIVVCVKHVPETAEAELKIDASGKGIEKTGLVFDINEWDDYALEEAVRIKEKQGGTVVQFLLLHYTSLTLLYLTSEYTSYLP